MSYRLLINNYSNFNTLIQSNKMKMGFSRSLLFLSQITLINFVSFTISQDNTLLDYFCDYTSSAMYQTNRDTLFSSLSAGINTYGYYSSSHGEDPDKVYAMVLCRADAELDLCRECINNATAKLAACPANKPPSGWGDFDPNDKEGIVWYDYCTVRYSSKVMEGIMAGDPRIFVWDDKHNVTSVEQFTDTLRNLLNNLRGQAAGGGTLRKFASGNTRGPTNYTIYALTQCTPDLSKQDCSDCLQGAIDNIPLCCNGRAGGRVLRPSCNFRYEVGPFFREIPGKGNNRTRIIIVIVASVTTFVIVLIVSISILLRKKNQGKPRKNVEFTESGDGISSVESLQYDFNTVKVATNNFSDANKLGQGGFGAVYKGRLLNGQEIAVKRLSKQSHQGDIEFKNEVMLVAKLQHRNLVRLLGFCLEGRERLLIYEFVPNASLDNFLFDPKRRDQMDWDRRSTIIEGIARGLVYLHQDSRLRIIHRDLKASNVLLDEKMNPKIADFGLARLCAVDETHGSTSRIAGTPGYMAPEYRFHGEFSDKSDVFSYGVLLLEILSGQKNNRFRTTQNEVDLISNAWKCWRDGTASDLIDPVLRANSSSTREMIMRYIQIGLLCVQENVAERPTMGSVLLMLGSSSLALSDPSLPKFFQHSITLEVTELNKDSTACTNESTQSVNEVSISELDPR